MFKILKSALEFRKDNDYIIQNSNINFLKTTDYSVAAFERKCHGKKIVVIYDSGSGSHYLSSSADTACLWAKKLGFEKVYMLVGGFKAWKEGGYPTTLEAPSCCK